MRASIFTRERLRIERQWQGKRAGARKALQHLVRREGAALVIEGNRRVGYRMRDGSVACLKVRYHSVHDAAQDIARIQGLPNSEHKPCRVYLCPWCSGFHLTSRAQ